MSTVVRTLAPAAVLVLGGVVGCFSGFDPETVSCRLGAAGDCPSGYACMQVGEGVTKCRPARDGSPSADGVPQPAAPLDSAGLGETAGAGPDAGRVEVTRLDASTDGDASIHVDGPGSGQLDGTADIPLLPPEVGGSGGSGGSGGATLTGGTIGASGTLGTRDAAETGAGGAVGGKVGTGGSAGAGGVRTGGATASGGIGTGGVVGVGGAGTGGAGTGGVGTGGSVGSGGVGTGGTSATGGTPGTGGLIGTGGAGARSSGCGRTSSLSFSTVPGEGGSVGTGDGGYVTIQSSGQSRGFAMRLPDNYDNNRPYWLVFAFHWNGGTARDLDTGGANKYTDAYFGLQKLSNNGAIFVAPQGIGNGWPNSSGQDLTFVDDMVKVIEDNYCVDTTRLYANGFSYGGGMTYAIACARATVFRAIAIYNGAVLSGCVGGSNPIAYWQMAGLTDGSINISAALPMRDKFALANGCNPPASEAPRPPAPAPYLNPGGHICTDYTGCSSGHPLRWCVHQSGTTWAPVDGTGDAYNSCATPPSTCSTECPCTWVPQDVWSFFTSL